MKSFIASFTITLALIATIALSSPAQAAGINGNPWNYSFIAAHGSLIYTPNPAFCNGNYFHCIPNFPRGIGYVVECHDGLFSKSGGRPGSCSKHGGESQVLYSHVSSSVAHGNPSPPISSNHPVSFVKSSNPSPDLPFTGSDPYATNSH